MDIEKIKTQMCDNYCKHFEEIRATFEDIDRGQEELDRICEHCPLNELEKVEVVRCRDCMWNYIHVTPKGHDYHICRLNFQKLLRSLWKNTKWLTSMKFTATERNMCRSFV